MTQVLTSRWCPSWLVSRAGVNPVLQYGDVFVEAICLHAELDAVQVGVLEIQFGDDGASLGLEGGSVLVVVLVSLNLSEGCQVGELADHFCQGVVGGAGSLQQFEEPLRHGGHGVL